MKANTRGDGISFFYLKKLPVKIFFARYLTKEKDMC